MMTGCKAALDWVANLQVSKKDAGYRDCVLERMRYEFRKSRPVEPKFHKGKYGSQYDSYTCGNCGCVISVTYHYCPNCGFRITDNYLGRRKTAAEQGSDY